MGLTLEFWDPFRSFFSYVLINTYDIGHTSVYGLEIALHSLQLLNKALLYMWYFNGFKQTNKQHTHTAPDHPCRYPRFLLGLPLQSAIASSLLDRLRRFLLLQTRLPKWVWLGEGGVESAVGGLER